jgi:hypothetical protein
VSHLTLLPEHLAGRSTPSSSQPPRFNASSLNSNGAIDNSTTVCHNLKFSAWRNERRLIGRSCVFGTPTALNANVLMITSHDAPCEVAGGQGLQVQSERTHGLIGSAPPLAGRYRLSALRYTATI